MFLAIKSSIMASLKLTIDSRRVHIDNKYPIIIRLTVNSLSTSLSTGVKIFKNQWDNTRRKVLKNNSDYKELNLILTRKISELQSKLLNSSKIQEIHNVKDLKCFLLGLTDKQKITFYEFAFQEIQRLKDLEKFGNAQSYETAVKRFCKKYGKHLKIDEITYSIIYDFDYHLIKQGLSKNTVAVYMREIRALLNKAINKGLIDKSNYPFSKYKITSEKTISRAITKTELESIRALELEVGSNLWHSRNIFFLIFNLIGISFIDLVFLGRDSFIEGRIVYKRRKTGKLYSIKITEEASSLFKLYQGADNYYFSSIVSVNKVPKNKEKHEVNLKIKVINKNLKKIGLMCGLKVNLTTYVARYSWANIAKSYGYSKDLIAEALGHEYGNRITGIYLDNYGSDIIDNANEKVTSFQNFFM